MVNSDFSVIEMKMADRITEHLNSCSPMELLNIYSAAFGEDENTNQLRKEIAGEE